MKDTKKSKEQLIAELVESEEKYRIQVEMATDAVFLETVEGRILECNTAGAKMFGYTKEEMVDLTIADLVPEKFVKVLPKIITEKDTTYGKFVSRISKKKDGTIFPTEIATKLINIRKKPRLIAYIRDITERKRAEKKQKSLLKKEREQHLKAKTLAKVTLILTSKLSLSNVLKEVLRQVKRLVPYSACNIVLIQKGGLSNIHSVGYDKYGSKNFVNNFRYPLVKIPLVKEVVKLAKPRLISDTHQNPRWIFFKETSWIRSHLVVPICLGDKVIGLLNLDDDIPGKFVKDDIEKLQSLTNAAAIALENARLFEEVRKEITERKQAEKALVESEKKYRTVFENTGTATIIIEEDKTISMANTQSEKLTGYSKDEIENKIKWTDFIIPEDLKIMEKYHRERRKAGGKVPTEYEFRLIDKKGNIKNTFLKVGMIPGSKKSIVSLTDITERKQAEQELRESEARLNEAQRIAQIGSWELDLITNTLYWSDEIYRMFDLKPEQFSSTYEAFLDNIHPDDRVFVDKAYTESVKNKTPYDIVHRLPLKDGTLKFVNERCKTFYDDAGKAVRSIGTIQDITERKKVEEALRESETKFREMAELLPEVVYECDAQGNLTFANKVAFEKFGYTRGDFRKGLNMQQFIAPDDRKRVGENIEKIFRGIKRGSFEYIALRKDGSEFPITTYSSPIIRDGKSVGLRGIIIDITERKQAEQELRESEENMRAVLDASSDVIHLLDINGIILSTNEGFAKRLGLEVDDIVGKCVFDYFPRESIHKRKAAIDKVFRTGEPLQLEDKGLVSVFESHVQPVFNPAGEVTAVAVYARDITERKKAEERLKKTINATIETVSKTIEAKDPYTSGHQHKVSQLATAIAKELNLSPDKIEGIRIASLIHDIGKIGIPSEILSKPITLTDKEFNLIKDHSQIGYDILKPIDFSYPIAQIVLQHHERIDGSGYDQGLKGNKILLEARIIGVADVVEAMSSHRPYRPALGIDKALEEITQKKGIFYDPEVVDACLKLFKEKGFKFE